MRIFGFEANATATVVEYTAGEPAGDFGQPGTPGEWRNAGDSVDVILLSLDAEEQFRAGVDSDPRDRELHFSLNGNVPINTRQTLDIQPKASMPELAGDAGRYNVLAVAPYAVSGFEKVGIARVRRI